MMCTLDAVRRESKKKEHEMFWITPNFPLSLERSIYATTADLLRRMHGEEWQKNTLMLAKNVHQRVLSEARRRRKKHSERMPHIKLSECFLRDSSTVKCDF